MSETDRLYRFLFEDLAVRGEVVHLDGAWRQILENHEYPPAVRSVLGESMAAAVLLGSTLKYDGMLTLQVQGNGPMGLLVAQCTSDRKVRGLAKWKGDAPTGSFTDLVGEGRLAITVERGAGKDRYQGIVPLEGETLAACLDAYFEGSVQVPTRLWLCAGNERVSGLLMQRLPDSDRRHLEEQDDWLRLLALAGTLTDRELLDQSGQGLLSRVFSEDDVRLFDGLPVGFECSCSRDRVAATLRMLGREEITGLVEERGNVEVRCEFCNRGYRFDPIETAGLFTATSPTGGSRTVH